MNPVKGKKYREPRAGIRHLFPIVVILIAPLVVCFLHVAGIDEIHSKNAGKYLGLPVLLAVSTKFWS